MKEICDRLDTVLLQALPGDGIKFFGLCQIIKKNEQPFPVTIEDNKQVSIDDKWDAICFHRLNGPAGFTQSEEQDFGKSTGKKVIQPMRTFIAHKVKKGESWIFDFLNWMPESVEVTDADGTLLYEFVDIGDINVETDQEAIYVQEFGENNYEKHAIPWNIYALDYGIEFIKCQ